MVEFSHVVFDGTFGIGMIRWNDFVGSKWQNAGMVVDIPGA